MPFDVDGVAGPGDAAQLCHHVAADGVLGAFFQVDAHTRFCFR